MPFVLPLMNCCVASLQWQIFSGAFDFSVPYYYDRYYDLQYSNFSWEKFEILFSRIKKTREAMECHTQCFLEITSANQLKIKNCLS
jgi:hypothetical protein